MPTVYGATVDREYLHFVETHVVAEAGLVDDLGLVRSRIGVPTVEVAVAVDVRAALAAKRAAIAAHASQIPESSSVLQLPDHHFADVYGWEWFVRWGARGPLDGSEPVARNVQGWPRRTSPRSDTGTCAPPSSSPSPSPRPVRSCGRRFRTPRR